MGEMPTKFPTASVASPGRPYSWLVPCWLVRAWPVRGWLVRGWPARRWLAWRWLARGRPRDGAGGGTVSPAGAGPWPGTGGMIRVPSDVSWSFGAGVASGTTTRSMVSVPSGARIGSGATSSAAARLSSAAGLVRRVRSGLGGRALLRRDAVRSVVARLSRGRRVVGEPFRGRPGFLLHGRGIFFLRPGCGSRHAGQGQRRPLDRRQHGGQFRARPDPGLLPFLLLIDLRGGRVEPVIHRAHTPGSRPELAGTVGRVEEYQTCDNDENEQLSHVSRHHWRAFGMTPSLCEAVSAPGWLGGGVGPD